MAISKYCSFTVNVELVVDYIFSLVVLVCVALCYFLSISERHTLTYERHYKDKFKQNSFSFLMSWSSDCGL